MAEDPARRADEETSQHEAVGYPGARPAQPVPTAPASSNTPRPQWQPPQPPAAPGWNEPQPGWNQPPSAWNQQQAGWQQPAQPGWQAPQQGWQAQGGWQQQPGYWAGQAPYGSSGGAIVAAIILLLYGIPLLIFGGLVTLVALSVGEEFTRQLRDQLATEGLGFDVDALLRFVVVLFAIMLILGLVHVVAAIGVLMHKGWGRILGAVMAVLGVLFGLLTVLPGLTLGEPASLVFGVLILGGYGLVLVGLVMAGSHFRRVSAGGR